MELLNTAVNRNTVLKARRQNVQVSSFCFGLYIYFLIDFFLHLSARIPGYGALRPTLLLVVLISFSLFIQRERLKDLRYNAAYKSIIVLIFYILISLPLVE